MMVKKTLYKLIVVVSSLFTTIIFAQDPVADNMLLDQRSIGGWPKHINEVKVDYTKTLSEAEKAGLVDDKFRNDATIDNNATTKEIRQGQEDFKTVLENCTFDGYEGFKLGRYHRDAQFYLIGCSFSKNMADKNIYQVVTTNILQWPRRVYYADCHKEDGDYAQFKNNLATAKGSPEVKILRLIGCLKENGNPPHPLQLVL